MKNLVVLIAIAAVAVVCVIAFLLPERKGDDTARGEEILQGIRFEFTNDGDAGEYYGKMIRSFLARKTGSENPTNLTEEERKWFMLGTSCRTCNLYPGQLPHIMPYARIPEGSASKDIARIAAGNARRSWQMRRDKEAVDILRRVGVFGWHIEQQEECVILSLVGTQIQWVAYDYLARFYEARANAEKADEHRDYIEAKRKSLSPFAEFRKIADWSHFERIRNVALTHQDSLWRKEACLSMMSPFVLQNRQAQAAALQVLRTVAQKDADPVVRQYAAACFPYVAGQKRIPQ